jgi:hypothetical protein
MRDERLPRGIAIEEVLSAALEDTGFWLRLIQKTQPHDQQNLAGLLKECDELLRMLNSIILTTRRKFAGDDSQLQRKTQITKLSTQHSALPSA